MCKGILHIIPFLIDDMTVYQNIMLALKYKKDISKSSKEQIFWLLKRVGLEKKSTIIQMNFRHQKFNLYAS